MLLCWFCLERGKKKKRMMIDDDGFGGLDGWE